MKEVEEKNLNYSLLEDFKSVELGVLSCNMLRGQIPLPSLLLLSGGCYGFVCV